MPDATTLVKARSAASYVARTAARQHVEPIGQVQDVLEERGLEALSV